MHGRGGQGVKKCAQIIARTAYLAGFYTQDFAIYGAERQGAPVTSFVRISEKPILVRGYIFEPQQIIALDESIAKEKIAAGLATEEIIAGKRKGTRLFMNTQKRVCEGFVCVDATGVALKETGKPIANTAILGAFFKKNRGIAGFGHLEKAIRQELGKYSKEVLDANVRAAKKCFEMA